MEGYVFRGRGGNQFHRPNLTNLFTAFSETMIIWMRDTSEFIVEISYACSIDAQLGQN